MSPRSLFTAGLLAASCVYCALPAQAQFTAYNVPNGAGSTQFIPNPLGMDFDVNSPILITALGVFDSGQDGLAFATPVYIYDRNTQLSVVSLTIPAGTGTTLIGGSRFVNLVTPFTLNAGFHGSIVEDPNTIARSLVTKPSMIMLDEPFSGVDPIAVNDVQQIVQNLRDAGLAILITDHNVRETLSIVDRAYLIFEGSVVTQGTKDFLINDPVARRVYLGEGFQM